MKQQDGNKHEQQDEQPTQPITSTSTKSQRSVTNIPPPPQPLSSTMYANRPHPPSLEQINALDSDQNAPGTVTHTHTHTQTWHNTHAPFSSRRLTLLSSHFEKALHTHKKKKKKKKHTNTQISFFETVGHWPDDEPHLPPPPPPPPQCISPHHRS